MITRAQESDLNEIIMIWEETSREDFARQIGTANIEYFIESGELSRESKFFLRNTYVLRDNGIIAGFVVILGNLIELLIVDQEYRNTLCAQKLYKHALKVISRKHDHVRAECFELNDKANSMLQRLGYDLKNTYLDNLGFLTNIYHKRLQPNK